MSEDVRCHTLELRFEANAIEDTNHSDKMAISPISRKDQGRTLANRPRLDTVHRKFAQHTDLCAALRVGEADAVLLSVEPEPLQSQHLHSSKSRKKHQANGSQSGRMLPFRRGLAHHLSELREFVIAQSALLSFAGELPNAFRGISPYDLQASGVSE